MATKKISAGNNNTRAKRPQRAPHAGDFKKGNTHGLGNPTKYKEEYVQAVVDYFAKGAKECIVDGIDAQENYKAIAKSFVTLDGFAASIKVSRMTINAWRNAKNTDGSEKYPDFVEALSLAQTIQADLLIRGGMTGAFKGGFATMAAMNIEGVAWKTVAEAQIEHSVTDESLNKFAEIAERNKQKSAEMMEKMKSARNITS